MMHEIHHYREKVDHTKLFLHISISKLDLCEGGSFSPTIFNSDIELSVFPISCFISVCRFVEGNVSTYAENSHIVFSSRY